MGDAFSLPKAIPSLGKIPVKKLRRACPSFLVGEMEYSFPEKSPILESFVRKKTQSS